MNVSLPAPLEEFVGGKVAAGEFQSADEVELVDEVTPAYARRRGTSFVFPYSDPQLLL